MAIDIPTETAVGQGTDTWDGIDEVRRLAVRRHDDSSVTTRRVRASPSFFGGDGVDTVDGSAATAGVNINLDILDPSGADDLENVVGSAFNDTLDGNDNRNQINAGAGDDFLDGQPGNDTLLGEAPGTTRTSVTRGATGSASRAPGRPNGKVTVDLSLGFATGDG